MNTTRRYDYFDIAMWGMFFFVLFAFVSVGVYSSNHPVNQDASKVVMCKDRCDALDSTGFIVGMDGKCSCTFQH